jgi:uroporphyrinogen-III synthase
MRVLVTRARDQAEATAARLAAMRHAPLLAPVTEVAPTGLPPPAGRFDAVLVTSQNAVSALAAECPRYAGTPVLAVGQRTAQSLRDAGFDQVREAGGDSRALSNLVLLDLPRGSRLLHPAGRDRKPEPSGSLLRAGYDVLTWVCYEARAATDLPAEVAEALRAGRVDAVLHYSRRSAELFCALVRRGGLGEALAGTSHLCLSPDVVRGLRELVGLKLLIAARPEEASLFELLARTAPGPGSQPPQSRC